MTRGDRVVLLSLALAVFAVCGADLTLFAVRSHRGDLLSFVYVRKYTAVSDGYGRYHFAHYADMDEPCVRTLLPHRGTWPCWWVRWNRDDWRR
jgi:hypothetical protein